MRHFIALALLALAFALAAYLLIDSSEPHEETVAVSTDIDTETVVRAVEPIVVDQPIVTPDPMYEDPAAQQTVVTVEHPELFCPHDSSLSIRLWDTTGVMWSSPAPELTVRINPGQARSELDLIINASLFCQSGQGTWEGQVSPVLTSATIGPGSESIGVHVRVHGEDRPAFVCWDTAAPHGNPNYHRIQFRTLATDQAGCSPGTL